MILPSDDDSRRPDDPGKPPGKKGHGKGKGDQPHGHGDQLPGEPHDDEDDEDFDETGIFDVSDDGPSIFDDPPPGMAAPGSGIHAPAPPGWREELREELDECLDELAEIEDPSQDFDPPDAPDLYTFYGELAALRTELRRGFRRSAETADKLGHVLGTLPSQDNLPRPLALAIIAMADRMADAAPGEILTAALDGLLAAAGIERIPTVGRKFNPAAMTMVASVPAPKGTRPGIVVAESVPGYRSPGGVLRPASVTVASAAP